MFAGKRRNPEAVVLRVVWNTLSPQVTTLPPSKNTSTEKSRVKMT